MAQGLMWECMHSHMQKRAGGFRVRGGGEWGEGEGGEGEGGEGEGEGVVVG